MTPKPPALELFRGGGVGYALGSAGGSADVSVLDPMAVFHKPVTRMGKSKPHHFGFFRQFTGWVALCLLLLINFKSATLSAAVWLVDQHGHDHRIAVQSDAHHLEVKLSHAHEHDQPVADHDHDDTGHVLRFNLNEVPDQISQRNVVNTTPTTAPLIAVSAINSISAPPISTKSAKTIPPESPPTLTVGLLGLRTTVLLV